MEVICNQKGRRRKHWERPTPKKRKIGVGVGDKEEELWKYREKKDDNDFRGECMIHTVLQRYLGQVGTVPTEFHTI